MFQKKMILTTLALGSLTIGSAAFAAGSAESGAPNDKRDDVRFECRFRCDEFGKKDDDRAKCEAEGKLDAGKLHDNDWVLGDKDDFLRIRCDRDDLGENESRDGKKEPGILYGRHFDDLFITGDDTASPLIVVGDVRELEGKHSAKLLIFRKHRKLALEGECRFERGDDITAPGAKLN